MASDLRHLMRRLSKMPGQGSPQDWLESVGPVVEGILREAGVLAGVLVDRCQVEMQYRPTPFALKVLLQTMESEEGDRVAERRRARSRACICRGRGVRTVFVETWRGERGQLLRRVPVTLTTACVCPQGTRMSESDLGGERWLTLPQWEARIQRKLVPMDGRTPGPTRYWVDDGFSAPPSWTRTDWMQQRMLEER